MTTNGRRRRGVSTDQQLGIQDEPVPPETGILIKEWFDIDALGAQARATLKAISDAKDKAMGALPGDDGGAHRYTWIDEETGPEPVQYCVNTTPPTPASKVEFTREPKRRGKVDKVEAPRE